MDLSLFETLRNLPAASRNPGFGVSSRNEPPSLGEIESALFAIPAEGRETWLKVGMALQSELGEDGAVLFDNWSQTGSTYKAKDCLDVWRSFKGGGVGIKSLFKMAYESGWTPANPGTVAPRITQPNPPPTKNPSPGKPPKTPEEVMVDTEAAPGNYPYLVSKNVQAHGARLYRGSLTIAGMNCHGCLAVPLVDVEGKLQTVQLINQHGEKRFLPGCTKKGAFFLIGGEPATRVFVAEGFATAATIFEAKGIPVAVAIDSGNLLAVSVALRKRYPNAVIDVTGDDDIATPGNPGRTKATEAAATTGGIVFFPPFTAAELAPPLDAAPGWRPPTDFNDFARLRSLEAVKQLLVPTREDPEPPEPDADMADTEELFDERAAIAEFDGGVPREWSEGMARLSTMPRPEDIPKRKWRLVKLAAAVFADKWAVQASRLGWTVREVFGCNANEPCRRWDGQGLIFSLADGSSTLEELHTDKAAIRTKGGALQFFRKPLTAHAETQRLLWGGEES